MCIRGEQLMIPRSMLYLLALLCPPLAVLSCGRGDRVLLSVVLTLCLWLPGAIHALLVVQRHSTDREGIVMRQEMQQHRLNSTIRRL